MLNDFSNKILPFLGRSNKDKSFINFLCDEKIINNGIINLPLYDEDGEPLDEDSLYIEKKDDGICLILKDESSFLKKMDQPILGEKLFFSAIFFYNDGVEGYNKFDKILPLNLSFDMSRNEILILLGDPIESKYNKEEILISDKWFIPQFGYSIYTSYSIKNNCIRYFLFFI